MIRGDNGRLGFHHVDGKIVSIAEDSPAGRNDNLQIGDQIMKINQNVVSAYDTIYDIQRMLEKAGKFVNLTIWREGKI